MASEAVLSSTSQQLVDPEIGSALIEAAGSASVGELLLNAAQNRGTVEEVFAYRVANGGQPQVVASSSELADVAARVSLYTRRFHPFDPAVEARSGISSGSGFAEKVSATQIVRRDYRAACFERPRFADKLCFGWRLPDQWLMLSFYRRRADGAAQTRQLAALANVALTAFAYQATRRRVDALPLAERIELRIARAYPQLTRREREVCARSLAGSTAEQIAGELCVSRATVLTYRQRAYQRLEISQSVTLLDKLLD